MTQTIKNSLKMAERKVKGREDVTVYSTGSTPHRAAGEAMTVHAALAEKLIKAGKVTKENPNAKKKEA